MVPERMENAQAFFRVIETYLPLRISFAIRPSDFKNGVERVVAFDMFGNPGKPDRIIATSIYVYAYKCVMDVFNNNRGNEELCKVIGSEEKVDFYFDERSEKKIIISAWDNYVATSSRPDRLGGTPRFESDDVFLPLQAADFLAWWVREMIESGCSFEEMMNPVYPWKIKEHPFMIHAMADENDVATTIVRTYNSVRTASGFPGLGALDAKGIQSRG